MQRYQCKKYIYRFTVKEKSSKTASNEIKKQALHLYLERLGFKSIGRLLNFSHVAVYNWIKSYGENLTDLIQPQTNTNINVMEIEKKRSFEYT